MIRPCPRHVLCPTGTGSESPGVNYSSEDVDVPTYDGGYYPPIPGYGYYTACHGLCVSYISQEDADLCAQRNAELCNNNETHTGPGGHPKPLFDNTQQSCNEPNTGRIVIVPAGVFHADSIAAANAMALSYANKQQHDPGKPPVVIVPPPTPPKAPVTPGDIPRPVPQPHPTPPPPPTSHCQPCDDSSAVSSFTVVGDIPDGVNSGFWESPPLKCGLWEFGVVTNNAGDIRDTYIVTQFVAGDPARSPIDASALVDCPDYPMTWIKPCSPGPCIDPRTVLQFGVNPGCCNQTTTHCQEIRCQAIDGVHWLPVLQIFYNFPWDDAVAVKFTLTGTLISPLPTP